MAQNSELGTVIVDRDATSVTAAETFDVSVLGRLIGALGAFAFLSASLFFWQMPVEQADYMTPILRIVLCSGLFLFGILIGRSALIPRKSVDAVIFELGSRTLQIGKRTRGGATKIKDTVAFSDIKRFYAGSQGEGPSQAGGTTVLYMEGNDLPNKGVLIVGSVHEIENLAREANSLLNQALQTGNSQASERARVRFGKRAR